MKEFLCKLRAIPFFLKTGEFIPHIYREVETKHCDIWLSCNSFRIATGTLNHQPNEMLVKNVNVHKMVCIRCGHAITNWDDGNVREIPKEDYE